MRYLTYCIIVSVFCLYGCKKTKIRISEPSFEESQRIIPIGKRVSQQLLASLKGELEAAVAEGGFEKAIEVCHLRAEPIKEAVEKSTAENIRVKRTTHRSRNPDNNPDEVEDKALLYFENIIDKGESIPEFYIQKVTRNDSAFFYFFKPLKIESLCLGCHGKTENISPAVVALLGNLYPGDKATGYSEGEFRGLVSVIIPE